MLSNYTEQFFVGVAVGSALGAAGLAHLFTLRRTGATRLIAAVAAAAVPLAVFGVYQPDRSMVAGAAGVVLAAIVALYLLGSRSLAAVVARPGVRWGGLAVVGVMTVVGSCVWYDMSLEADWDGKEQELLDEQYQPNLLVVASPAVTDRGMAVEVKHPADRRPADMNPNLDESRLRKYSLLMSVIRLAPADDTSNCHGWVFTHGKYWVGGLQVDPILKENGYQLVSTPKVGDLVVYRDLEEKVTHTAVVRSIPEGGPVLLESKWGCLGVFLHPPDKSPYGETFAYYRSSRAGHLLAGLPSPAGSVKIGLP